MEIKAKYEVGDKIKFLNEETRINYMTCPCCNGEKEIKGYDNNFYPCPLCDEEGRIQEKKYTIQTEKEGIISSVHIHYDSNNFEGIKVYYNVPRWPKSIYEEKILRKE